MKKSKRDEEYERIATAITVIQLQNAAYTMSWAHKAENQELFHFGKFMESLATTCIMNVIATLEKGGSIEDGVKAYFDAQHDILEKGISNDVAKQWDPTEVERVRSGFGILDDSEDSDGDEGA